MKQLVRTKHAVSVAAILLLATTCAAQDAARLEQVVQESVKSARFMGAVLVARGGDVILSKGYGSANVEWDIPNSPTTKFRLGSITKQFTAASILLLEERGKLKIDDPIKKYFADQPAAWDGITIYNLLTHTSGIFNYTAVPGFGATQGQAATPQEIVDKIRERPLDFAPGEKMSYSNTGYVLLGSIIEKLSGESYSAFLEKNIFAPLGMKDSGYESNSAITPRRAAGYTAGPNGFANAPFVHMSVPFAAGALYSTPEDLLRWEQALFGGKLLSAESLRKMTTPFKNNYAFGVAVTTAKGRKVVQHNGGIAGFNTYMAYYPETQITVIVLANVNGRTPDQMGPVLGAIAHGDSGPTDKQ